MDEVTLNSLWLKEDGTDQTREMQTVMALYIALLPTSVMSITPEMVIDV
jgi:hypothetical protein